MVRPLNTRLAEEGGHCSPEYRPLLRAGQATPAALFLVQATREVVCCHDGHYLVSPCVAADRLARGRAARRMPLPAAAQGPEGAFERTLKVTGAVDLEVQSGSGSIRVEPGAAGSVRVAARLKAGNSWLAGSDVEKRIRQIEQNPPIEQQGNVIRIGRFADEDLSRNISISYEVTVPADTKLAARTGSGSIVVGAIRGRPR